MKKILILVAILTISHSNLIKADNKVFDLNFKPLLANIQESRIGVIFTNSDEKLRLDIGGSYDLFQKQYKELYKWSIGVDFFTFTKLRSEGKMKFPVETTDFYFGINSSNITKYENAEVESRVRVGHISTHLSDGFSDDDKFFQSPFVYSREFVDFTIAYRKKEFRPYLGITAVFSYIPKDVNLIIPNLGIEFKKAITPKAEIQLAYDFKVNGYDGKYFGMNNIVGGILFKTSENRGVLLKAEYYSGEDYYGQFYKSFTQYLSIGFQIDY